MNPSQRVIFGASTFACIAALVACGAPDQAAKTDETQNDLDGTEGAGGRSNGAPQLDVGTVTPDAGADAAAAPDGASRLSPATP